MTIILTPETEAKLREQAERDGKDPGQLADLLLQEALEAAARDFEESCAAVAESLAGDPADDMPLEEFRARFEAGRAARRTEREAVA